MRTVSLRHPLVLLVVAALVGFSVVVETMQTRGGRVGVAGWTSGDDVRLLTTDEGLQTTGAGDVGSWSVHDVASGRELASGRGFGAMAALDRDQAHLLTSEGLLRIDLGEEVASVSGPDAGVVGDDFEALGLVGVDGGARLVGRDAEGRRLLLLERSLGGWISRELLRTEEGRSIVAAAPSAVGPAAATAVIDDGAGGLILATFGLDGTRALELHAPIPLAAGTEVLGLALRHDAAGTMLTTIESDAGEIRAVVRVAGGLGATPEQRSSVRIDGDAGTIGPLGGETRSGLVMVRDASVVLIAPDAVGEHPMRTLDADVDVRGPRLAIWLSLLVNAPALLALFVGVIDCARNPGISDFAVPVRPAPLVRRMLAALVDLGLANALAVLAYGLWPTGREVLMQRFGAADAATLSLDVVAPYSVIVFVAFVFVAAVAEWRFGATPGKLWMGLRVTAETGEAHLSLWRCFARRSLIWVDVRYVTSILAFLSPRRQRLGDLVSKTMVADARPPAVEEVD